MVLLIEILSGSLTGKKYRVENGLAIGRREGTILIEDDSKVSGLHAKIETDSKGQLVLLDQGSANGMVINGRRVKRVAMMRGVKFRVGETDMQVVEQDLEDAQSAMAPRHWQDEVELRLRSEPGANRQIEGAGLTFTPILRLDFVQGIQAEEQIVLSYGPRVAGLGHLDIDLKEPEASDVSFEIHPTPGSALFRDRSRGKIRINRQRPEPDQILEEGDHISLGGTLIRVRYL